MLNLQFYTLIASILPGRPDRDAIIGQVRVVSIVDCIESSGAQIAQSTMGSFFVAMLSPFGIDHAFLPQSK